MASTEEGAVMEKIDMSLDDIIKLNRQGGKRSQRGNFRAREITRGKQQAKRAQPETVGGRKSQRGAAGTRGVQRGFLNVRGLRGAVGARGSYRGTMGAVGSRQGAMGLPRGSRRARGLQRGAMGARGHQRGAMGARGLQHGAMGVRGLQRGAMGVRGLQRGAMGVRGLQRGARAARELQVGAMGPNGFQRNASGARAVLRGPMKKRGFPPAASGAPMMTGRGRGVGGVGMGGSIWGLARGGRAVRAGTPWRRGIASGSTALKRRLGGMMPGHMAAGVRPRVRLESRRLGSGQESQQDLTTSTTSSFRQAVRIRQREARRALLNLRRGLQTQTAVPSLKQKRRPSAKQRNKQMGESSVTSSSLLTVSITNPQAPISNKQRSLRPPVLAKPAPTQPKGVPLRYNIRQLSNQTKLTLNERFSTLQRERVQRPGTTMNGIDRTLIEEC